MNNLALRLKMAKQKGEATAKEFGVTSLPINPFDIAKDRDITVQAKENSEGGVSGMLLRYGDKFGIIYATHISSIGFQHFSIAHELGHYFLDGHIDHVLPKDGCHVSLAGFVSEDPFEKEADAFAAGLLMPEYLLRQAINNNPVGLKGIRALAELCCTSLTASAIRYAELTKEAIAVIVSTDMKVDFCILSEAMKSLPQLTWLRKGTPVPKETITAEFNNTALRNMKSVPVEDYLDISVWFGGSCSEEAKEEVVSLGSYEKTLTVLACSSLSDGNYQDYEEIDEEDLIESWRPKFRK